MTLSLESLPIFEEFAPKFFEIDVSECAAHPEKWAKIFSNVAEIVQSIESGKKLPDSLQKFVVKSQKGNNQVWKEFYCEACDLKVVGSFQWEQHEKSKRHKKRMQGNMRRKKRKLNNECTGMNEWKE